MVKFDPPVPGVRDFPSMARNMPAYVGRWSPGDCTQDRSSCPEVRITLALRLYVWRGSVVRFAGRWPPDKDPCLHDFGPHKQALFKPVTVSMAMAIVAEYTLAFSICCGQDRELCLPAFKKGYLSVSDRPSEHRPTATPLARARLHNAWRVAQRSAATPHDHQRDKFLLRPN